MDGLTRVVSFLCAVGAGAAAALADDTMVTAVAVATPLDAVNVVANRSPHTARETAGTVTVITEQQIDEGLVNGIADLVRYEPDLSVAREPTRFGNTGFTIRGIGGNRVLELVDGVPVADTFLIGDFSDASRDFLDPELIKRVEILRGAASALYGSDAIGGVVSITTKDPQEYLKPSGKSWAAAAKAGYASADNSHIGTALGAVGDQANAGLFLFSRRDGHELDNRGGNGSSDATRTEPNPQNFYADNFLAKGTFKRDDAIYRLNFSGTQAATDTNVLSAVGSQDLSAQVGFPYVIQTSGENGHDSRRAFRLGGEAELHAGGQWFDVATLRLYGEDSRSAQNTIQQRDNQIAGTDTPLSVERHFHFKQDVAGLGADLTRGFATGSIRHALAYGLDLKLTRTSELRDGQQTNRDTGVSSKTVSPDTFPVRDFPPSLTQQAGLYGQDEIELGQDFRLIPGVRVDYYRLHAYDDGTYAEDNPGAPSAGLTHTSVSPKFGVLYDFASAWTAYAQYAHGFRAPSYDDVNIGFTNVQFGYTAIPNPHLKPESSDGVETGLRFGDENASASVAAFYNHYRDFIEPFVSLGVDPQSGLLTFQAQNFSAVRIYGAELRGSYAIAAVPGASLRWALAYTRGDNRQDRAPLNSIDPAKAVLGCEYRDPRQRFGQQLNATLVRRQSRVDDQSGGASSGNQGGAGGPLFHSPGYASFDVLAWVSLSERLRLDAGVFNFTNQKFWSWSSVQGQAAGDPAIDRYTAPGINGSVNLRLSL